jgi:hypothetical protein
MINKNIPAKAFNAAKAIKGDKDALDDLYKGVARGDKDALDTINALDALESFEKEGK